MFDGLKLIKKTLRELSRNFISNKTITTENVPNLHRKVTQTKMTELALDSEFICSKTFFPTKGYDPIPNVFWIDCENAKLGCYLWKPDTPNKNRKTLIYFHGNGETVKGYLNRPDVESIPDFVTQLKDFDLNLVRSYSK